MPLPNSLAAFPATDPGFAALPVSELLASADDLVSRIRLCFGLSRDAFDSGADRHANFGSGQIEPYLLAAVVRDAGAPVICETPGGPQEHLADFAFLRERL